MQFNDLLRASVLLIGGVATALAAVAVVIANRDVDEVALEVAAAWWLLAAALGTWLGRPAQTRAAIGRVLAGARTSASLPSDGPGRIALMRLWPIAAFALAAGVAGLFLPQVAAIGAGYAIATALTWRGRQHAVEAIEDRDGVRFYVEPSHAWEPLKLIRTPGLYRDRAPSAKPPPPPSVNGR